MSIEVDSQRDLARACGNEDHFGESQVPRSLACGPAAQAAVSFAVKKPYHSNLVGL